MIICQTRPFGFNYVDRRELSKVLRHDWIILFEKNEVGGRGGEVVEREVWRMNWMEKQTGNSHSTERV